MLRIAKFLRYTVFTVAILYLLGYFIIAFLRIRYPFDLDWIEGHIAQEVRRIIIGQKIYVSPSLDFGPCYYTPLYFYLSAMVSKVIGFSLMPARIISFIASTCSVFIIFLFVKRQTKSIFSGILASSIFVATFSLNSRSFDIVRVDPLFLFFLLAALYLVKFKETARSYILAGILFSLSFLTKQTALMIIVFIMPYVILVNRRLSIALISTIVLIIGMSTLLLNRLYDGWYNFYVFRLPLEYFFERPKIINFWEWYLSPLGIVYTVSASYLLSLCLNSGKKDRLFYIFTGISILITAFITIAKVGGYPSALLPLYAIMAILFGLGVHKFFRYISFLPAKTQRAMSIYIYLLCLVQLLSFVYNPSEVVPNNLDLEKGRALINAISEIKGEVFAPSHTYLTFLAGKKSYAHWAGIWNISLSRENQLKNEINKELIQAIREKRFSAFIHASGPALDDFVKNEVEKYYVQYRSLPHPQIMQWSGLDRVGDAQIYIRREKEAEK